MSYYRDYPEDDLPHSGVGIASFIVALFGGFIDAVLIVVAGLIELQHPGAIAPGSSQEALVGLFFCFGMLMGLVGLVLGIVGVCQVDRKKVFAILGLVLGALTLVGGGCTIAIGMAVERGF
jgi:hypothetical protein